MQHIPFDALISFGAEFLRKRGLPQECADYLSRFVVETEAFRSTTHGLVQFLQMHRLLGKSMDPDREPAIVRDKGAMALIDGEKTLGILCMKTARELAMAKAREFGVGFVAVRNTSWVGALGTHLIPLAEQGFLAQAWAQSCNCKDCAPMGGIDARFSTNPMAIAFPAGKRPVLADFSTASYSMATVGSMIEKKEKSKVPRFIDAKGKPSKTPSVVRKDGSIMFTGLDLEGHKFYGISLFIEALTALSGGSANNPEAPQRQSASILALDPDAFAGREYYRREMERFVKHVKSSRKRPGFDAVRLPGERGFAALDDAKRKGVPLDKAKLEMLKTIAAENGLAITWA